MGLKELLERKGACDAGREWAARYETLPEAWAACPRGDWMVWWLFDGSTWDPLDRTYASLRLATAAVLDTLEAVRVDYSEPLPRTDKVRAWVNDPAAAVFDGEKKTLVCTTAAHQIDLYAERLAYAAKCAGVWNRPSTSYLHLETITIEMADWRFSGHVARNFLLRKLADNVRVYFPVPPSGE